MATKMVTVRAKAPVFLSGGVGLAAGKTARISEAAARGYPPSELEVVGDSERAGADPPADPPAGPPAGPPAEPPAGSPVAKGKGNDKPNPPSAPAEEKPGK